MSTEQIVGMKHAANEGVVIPFIQHECISGRRKMSNATKSQFPTASLKPFPSTPKAFWSDGLLDLLIGICVLLIGLAWIYDLVALGAIAPAVIVPFWKPLRDRFTVPRVGNIQLSDSSNKANHHILIGSIIFGSIILAGGVALYIAKVSGFLGADFINPKYMAAVPAILFGVLAVFAAVITEQLRYVFYAGVCVVAGVTVVAAGLDPGWALLAVGVAATVSGLIVLTSFIRQHPRVARTPQSDKQTP